MLFVFSKFLSQLLFCLCISLTRGGARWKEVAHLELNFQLVFKPSQPCIIQNFTHFLLFPPASYCEHDAICNLISLGWLRVSCSSCGQSQFLVHAQPPHWWGGVRSRKGLDCAGIAQQSQIVPELSTLFSAKIQYIHSILATEKKIKFTVAKIITTSNLIIDWMSKLIRRLFLKFCYYQSFCGALKITQKIHKIWLRKSDNLYTL